VQDADGQNCRCRFICRLTISSESASATACGRAFQAGMVRGRNAYLNASTVGWKRWNCLGWPLAEFCGRGTGWYSCGTSTSPFVILYIMVSLLWSLRASIQSTSKKAQHAVVTLINASTYRSPYVELRLGTRVRQADTAADTPMHN